MNAWSVPGLLTDVGLRSMISWQVALPPTPGGSVEPIWFGKSEQIAQLVVYYLSLKVASMFHICSFYLCELNLNHIDSHNCPSLPKRWRTITGSMQFPEVTQCSSQVFPGNPCLLQSKLALSFISGQKRYSVYIYIYILSHTTRLEYGNIQSTIISLFELTCQENQFQQICTSLTSATKCGNFSSPESKVHTWAKDGPETTTTEPPWSKSRSRACQKHVWSWLPRTGHGCLQHGRVQPKMNVYV